MEIKPVRFLTLTGLKSRDGLLMEIKPVRFLKLTGLKSRDGLLMEIKPARFLKPDRFKKQGWFVDGNQTCQVFET